jgi:flagellar FliL protein
VTDLLLITDVPRLRKIFTKLSDNKSIHLRIASNLEKGAEELVAEKPGFVFVQTHLSGLSAEIILMHLKKQLGRKRTRFVLLSTPADAGSDTVRLYQGHIDISLDDDALLGSIKELISTLLTKVSKKIDAGVIADETVPELETHKPDSPVENVPVITSQLPEGDLSPGFPPEEPSLVEQGLTYAPRTRMSVYSEFNSSFDSAVSGLTPASPLDETVPGQHHDWNNNAIETIETSATRSKRAVFLLWLAPVVIAVVVITMLQHKRSAPTPSTESKKTSIAPQTAAKPVALQAPTTKTAQPGSAVPLAQAEKTALEKPAVEANAALSDKAVITAIAENRGKKETVSAPAENNRPTVLPDFIPRYAVDKSYAAANPGWERYKGQVTEFKVFREKGAIRAIQVIDRGGSGIPESFMKAAIRQVSKKPAFVMELSEKKEGFEIQRGQTGDNLKVMFYRDDQGGKLRAFVMTWN